MILKTLIIEDEAAARKTLKALLASYTPVVHIIGEAENISEGIKTIQDLDPDLVFLDMELKGQNGLDILAAFSERNFHTIITTAYTQYALTSYNYGVDDYILKPITPFDLKRAVERVVIRKKVEIKYKKENTIVAEELKLPFGASFKYVSVNKLIRLEASRNYTWVFVEKENPFLISKTLSILSEMVHRYNFVRIHHSHIINPEFLISFNKNTNMVELSDKSILPVSRERKKNLIEYLDRKHTT